MNNKICPKKNRIPIPNYVIIFNRIKINMNWNIPINVFIFLDTLFFGLNQNLRAFGELILNINLTNSANFLEKKNSPIFWYHKKLKRKTLFPMACIRVIVKYGCCKSLGLGFPHCLHSCNRKLWIWNTQDGWFLFQFCDVDKVMIILEKKLVKVAYKKDKKVKYILKVWFYILSYLLELTIITWKFGDFFGLKIWQFWGNFFHEKILWIIGWNHIFQVELWLKFSEKQFFLL